MDIRKSLGIGVFAVALGLSGSSFAEQHVTPTPEECGVILALEEAPPERPPEEPRVEMEPGAKPAEQETPIEIEPAEEPPAEEPPQEGLFAEEEPPLAEAAPAYWIADASLFLDNAAKTTRTLLAEQQIEQQQPVIVANQTKYLACLIIRSTNSLERLEQSAQEMKPEAVPVIRQPIAYLAGAETLASGAVDDATQGQLGTSFEQTLQSIYEHIERAQGSMNEVRQQYETPEPPQEN